MGITLTEKYSSKQNEMATLFKAIAHPARIAILQHLAEVNACINSDLVQELSLAQATISQHLQVLKDAGLISGSIRGTSLNYCINAHRWQEVRSHLLEFFDSATGLSESQCC